MECEDVRKEFPDIKFEPCCDSCHEDEEMGHGYDLWLQINGKDRHVCCAIMRSFDNV